MDVAASCRYSPRVVRAPSESRFPACSAGDAPDRVGLRGAPAINLDQQSELSDCKLRGED
jgi:hypothetical protein